MIRPPGARGKEFLSRCIRCGICLKVCPTSGLQPSFSQAGWAGVWTPVLVPRLGHCDYSCTACGQACPTAAIPPLALEDKRLTVIGHAYYRPEPLSPLGRQRHLPGVRGDVPPARKSHRPGGRDGDLPRGRTVDVRRPTVLRDRCIGCGICENRCPLNGEAAIRVYAPTELSGIG